MATINIRVIFVTFIVKRVLVTLNFLFGGPSVSSHIIEATVEHFQISKLAELLRNEGALEHEYVPRIHHLSPVAFQLFHEGERMWKVARDVIVHHVPVALTNVVTDGAAPIMTNEDELFAAELLCQVGNVIGEYIDRVVLYPRRLVCFAVTPIVHGDTPGADDK